MKKIVIACVISLTACAVQQPTRVVYVQAPPASPVYRVPSPQPVVSIYVEPPMYQPAPIRVEWAPPPMLVESLPPLPYEGAIWTGGYWVWEGNWVWAHGRWAPPPHIGYSWVNPYYENRGGSVVFINGFWAAPGVVFVAPSINVNIAFGIVAAGVVAGPRPSGPDGIFVPAPPGSRLGLVVPAPLGTAPAVVTSAPPIIREGMHINVNSNNVTNVNNVNNVTNINNVTVVAPASAMASGKAISVSVPAQQHLAAALPPVVKTFAPEPPSPKPIPAYIAGHTPAALPAAQMTHSGAPPALPPQRPVTLSPIPTAQTHSISTDVNMNHPASAAASSDQINIVPNSAKVSEKSVRSTVTQDTSRQSPVQKLQQEKSTDSKAVVQKSTHIAQTNLEKPLAILPTNANQKKTDVTQKKKQEPKNTKEEGAQSEKK